MAIKHIANREIISIAANVNPDFCRVGNKVIPFDIARKLDRDKLLYAQRVFARGQPVVLHNSIASGVIGNAGRGVASQVSRGDGHVWMEDNDCTVYAEDRRVVRHKDPCWMNCQVDPVPLKEEDIKDAES